MKRDEIPHTTEPNDLSTIFQDVVLSVGTILDLGTLLKHLVNKVVRITSCDRCLILVADDENLALRLGATNMPAEDAQTRRALDNLSIALYNADAQPVVGQWLVGEAQHLTAETTSDNRILHWLLTTLKSTAMFSQPLLEKGQLIGVIIIDAGRDQRAIAAEAQARLEIIARAGAVAVQNARIYSKTVHQAEAHLRELTILRQIDRELNDTIEPQHVFQMTLDWALRFTNAQTASIGLYDQDTDEFRIIATYGYDVPPDQLAILRVQRSGIAHRDARSAHAEVIPDVTLDKDFIRGANLTQSQLSVPVMREDRVIAVISVESKKLNGFTDEHQDFVEKLAARAGVAIDNARLFDTTAREREKLSHILNNTADIVIVIGMDERLILINPAAFSALRLYPHENYVGRKFQDVFANSALPQAYQQAQASSDPIIGEVQLPNGRVFHMNLTRQESVGWIIVMHDITPFKEMDRLKSELIATVSHDLKQPLAVMNGYIELLMMHRKLDDTGTGFLEMVRKSIQSMRQLIDDLLDLAKIEAGVRLDLQPVDVTALVNECVTALQPSIQTKNLEVSTAYPPDLPPLLADHARLQQILLNLISNAVKYTSPDGWVKVIAERRDAVVRINIQDNGMGISPEDQVHVFDRFYRVRRPETDSIEGTGLGLAIVKSLVEAHNGKIGLESRLGEGTTFYLILPTASSAQDTPTAEI